MSNIEYCSISVLRNTARRFSAAARNVICMWHSRVPMVISLLIGRTRSESKLVCVVFEVEEVAVGHASVQVLGSFHVGNIPPILHSFR